jgi:hypothetical protein
MRMIVATILASSLFVANASADTGLANAAPSTPGPLSPGKPAGVKQADIEAGGVLLWVGVLGLAAGIAILAKGTQGNSSATTTK